MEKELLFDDNFDLYYKKKSENPLFLSKCFLISFYSLKYKKETEKETKTILDNIKDYKIEQIRRYIDLCNTKYEKKIYVKIISSFIDEIGFEKVSIIIESYKEIYENNKRKNDSYQDVNNFDLGI